MPKTEVLFYREMNMPKKKKGTSDAVEILHRRYYQGRPERIAQLEITYPQPHYVAGQGFFHLFTKYTAGRELYFSTSGDGRTWSADQKLVGFGGHYQVSASAGSKIGKLRTMKR